MDSNKMEYETPTLSSYAEIEPHAVLVAGLVAVVVLAAAGYSVAAAVAVTTAAVGHVGAVAVHTVVA